LRRQKAFAKRPEDGSSQEQYGRKERRIIDQKRSDKVKADEQKRRKRGGEKR
jgi:hypothetical protein